MSSGARPPVPQPSSFQQPVLMGPPGSQRTQVCVCLCMDMGVLVSGCGCSPVLNPHFHFEIRMIIRTRHKARIYVDLCTCAWVIVSVDKTGSCMYCTLLPMLKVLVPPQVGVFPPRVSSGARPPVPQPFPLLQPVCGSRVCVCDSVCCMCA